MDRARERADRGEMNFLTDDEIAIFRADFQEKEKEIQRNIGIYLSGLVLVTGWIIGPQTKPLIKMALDNNGYNLLGFLAVVALNVVFTCFLIYKSLIIHEITQFIAAHNEPDSVYNYWEAWRRSKQSVTEPVRWVYSGILALLPVAVSAAVLIPLGITLFGGNVAELSEQLKQLDVRPDGALPTVFTTADQLADTFFLVKFFFVGVVAFHFVPLWFFYQNVPPTNKRWNEIHKFRIVAPQYDAGIEKLPKLNANDAAGQVPGPGLGRPEESAQPNRIAATLPKPERKKRRNNDDDDD